MGMTCTVHRATEAEIDRLLEDPDALPDFLDPGGASAVREVRPKGLLGLLLRLTPVRVYESVPEADAALPPADPEREVDIDKAWHGLHFLLTGSADEVEGPTGFLLSGGEALDDEGFARALRPDYVARLAGLLDSLTIEALRGRYDPRRMTELDQEHDNAELTPMRDAIYESLAGYLECQRADPFLGLREAVRAADLDVGALLDELAGRMDLRTLDRETDERLSAGLSELSKDMRRPMLLAYLG